MGIVENLEWHGLNQARIVQTQELDFPFYSNDVVGLRQPPQQPRSWPRFILDESLCGNPTAGL